VKKKNPVITSTKSSINLATNLATKLSIKKPTIKPLFKLLVITLPSLLPSLLLSALLGSVLTGCSNNPTEPNYSLDRVRLGRSAVFTQRELINEQFKESAAVDAAKRATLINSYCDLIDQSAIYVTRDNMPEECQSPSNLQRKCAYHFHLCVNTCSLRSNECLPCIEQARQCLDSE